MFQINDRLDDCLFASACSMRIASHSAAGNPTVDTLPQRAPCGLHLLFLKSNDTSNAFASACSMRIAYKEKTHMDKKPSFASACSMRIA